MALFVTGGSGFIGKRLVAKLLEREGAEIFALVRDPNPEKLVELRNSWRDAEGRVKVIAGDIIQPTLGLSAEDSE